MKLRSWSATVLVCTGFIAAAVLAVESLTAASPNALREPDKWRLKLFGSNTNYFT